MRRAGRVCTGEELTVRTSLPSAAWRRLEARLIQTKTTFLSWTPLRRVYTIVLAGTVAVYITLSVWIGGDAFQGREAGGRFFVTHNSGAAEHEVSRTTFLLSLWTLRVLAALWAIGLAATVRDHIGKAPKR